MFMCAALDVGWVKPAMLNAAFGFFLIAFTILIGALAVSSLLGKPLLSLFLAVSSCRGVRSPSTAGWRSCSRTSPAGRSSRYRGRSGGTPHLVT
jgi:hypothetical protein